jgi:hypothetical protein
MAEAIQLLVAAFFLRPYVFVFLAFYLTATSYGKIYEYPEPWLYFGVPLTNFLW